MRTHFLAGIVLACAATAAAGQTGSKPAPAQTPPLTPGKPLTLNGCVQKSEVDPNQFTLSDSTDGTTYRLTGADVRPHVGRKVRIVGGLMPSANIAAQAGRDRPVAGSGRQRYRKAGGPRGSHRVPHHARPPARRHLHPAPEHKSTQADRPPADRVSQPSGTGCNYRQKPI